MIRPFISPTIFYNRCQYSLSRLFTHSSPFTHQRITLLPIPKSLMVCHSPTKTITTSPLTKRKWSHFPLDSNRCCVYRNRSSDPSNGAIAFLSLLALTLTSSDDEKRKKIESWIEQYKDGDVFWGSPYTVNTVEEACFLLEVLMKKISRLGEGWEASAALGCMETIEKDLRSSNLGDQWEVLEQTFTKYISQLVKNPENLDTIYFCLHGKIMFGSYHLVKACIEAKIDVNHVDRHEGSLLLTAVSSGKFKIINLLVASGASTNDEKLIHEAILNYNVNGKTWEIITCLHKYGAKITKQHLTEVASTTFSELIPLFHELEPSIFDEENVKQALTAANTEMRKTVKELLDTIKCLKNKTSYLFKFPHSSQDIPLIMDEIEFKRKRYSKVIHELESTLPYNKNDDLKKPEDIDIKIWELAIKLNFIESVSESVWECYRDIERDLRLVNDAINRCHSVSYPETMSSLQSIDKESRERFLDLQKIYLREFCQYALSHFSSEEIEKMLQDQETPVRKLRWGSFEWEHLIEMRKIIFKEILQMREEGWIPSCLFSSLDLSGIDEYKAKRLRYL